MKKVLLYSGGLDSFCLAQIAKPDVLIYIDLESRYTKAELKHLSVPKDCEDTPLVHETLSLGRFEREQDLIIPARNAFMVLLAAQYGR